jgi:CheY-like chemotaxis protein
MGKRAQTGVAGLKILLVEDESLVAMMVEDALETLHCQVVGLASRLRKARALAERDGFDVAILDINIDGEPIYPVAAVLARRAIPFVFLTGYGAGGIAAAFRDRPTLQKPFQIEELREILAEAAGFRSDADSQEDSAGG